MSDAKFYMFLAVMCILPHMPRNVALCIGAGYLFLSGLTAVL